MIKDQEENNKDMRDLNMPPKAVVKETAQITKVHSVYDASVKSNLKDVPMCLETGLPLQNLIWDILTRSRFRPILLCQDIEEGIMCSLAL